MNGISATSIHDAGCGVIVTEHGIQCHFTRDQHFPPVIYFRFDIANSIIHKLDWIARVGRIHGKW